MSEEIFPLTAGQLAASRFAGKQDFFYLATAERKNGETTLTVDSASPVIANTEKMRDAVFAQSGMRLATRAEFSSGQAFAPNTLAHESMYTIATGAALWLRTAGQDEPMIYLAQNDLGKPVNPLKWNFPSGLVSGDPAETIRNALNRETGILFPTDNGKALIGLNFMPPGVLAKDFSAAAADIRRSQKKDIQIQLEARYREHAGKPIFWQNIKTIPAQDTAETVHINTPSGAFNMLAHVMIDDKARSANVHPVLFADLKNISMREIGEFSNPLVIDPDKFRRNANLFTFEDSLSLAVHPTHDSKGLTPAPMDHIRKRAVRRGLL